MASLSRSLMNDIAGMRKKFHAVNDFEAAHITNLAEDHVDGVSKRHLPPAEYLNVLSGIFESVKAMDFTTPREAEVLSEILELVDLYREMVAEESK